MKPSTEKVDTNYTRDYDALRGQQASRKAAVAEIEADKLAAGRAHVQESHKNDPTNTKRPDEYTEKQLIWLADHEIKSFATCITQADEVLSEKRPLTAEEELWISYTQSPEGRAEQAEIAADCKKKMREAGFGY